ncbi:MAG: Gfo/Idh/MocA family oxidoreductase [Desulfocapsaceae bacterium]|jgi:predicted dehydrogenase
MISSVSPVRLAVFGCGLVGERHVQHIIDSPSCMLTSIIDPSPHARKAAESAGVQYFEDVTSFLERPDAEAVIIATPNESHASLGIKCAKAGLHLFVEKPIDADLAAASELVDTATQEGVKLLVGHHRRFNPYIEAAKKIIDSGELGTISAVNILWATLKPNSYFKVDWRRESGGGPLLINLIHDIDNLRYLFGDIERVYAEASHAVRQYPVEDTAAISLRFRNGILGTMVISDTVASPYNFESGTGENPLIYANGQDCYWVFGTDGTLTLPEMKVWHYSGAGEKGWSVPISCQPIEIERTIPLVPQLEHFCAIIRQGASPRCSGQDAIKTLKTIMAIKEASCSGTPVVIS